MTGKRKGPWLTALLSAFLVVLVPETVMGLSTQESGFIGRVATEWLVDTGPDREMRLLEEFSFRDSKGELWTVPPGAVVDGASIPKSLWTLAGSPFVGDFRRASVIHDHYCKTRERPSSEVHEVFFEAMRADGVGQLEAKSKYLAVLLGGRHWAKVDADQLQPGEPEVVDVAPPEVSAAYAAEIERWIAEQNPSLEEIRQAVLSATEVE